MSQFSSHSPPPLRHPVPTHPAYIPEPPPTPGSPQVYQRFSSSPGPQLMQGQQHDTLNPPPMQGYPSHAPAYSAPFQHQYRYGMQPPTHQQQGMGAMNPQAQQQAGPGVMGGAGQAGGFGGAWGFDNPTAALGMQLGQNAVAAGQDYVQRNFGVVMPTSVMKHHFNVSNMYVINKIRLVLFPWTHRPWSRKPRGQGEWAAPRDDINSPDLYIPVMAIVTYILLVSLDAGLAQKFHPRLLGELASRAMVVLFLDFLFVKLGCYILNVQGSSQFIDILAYGGYKFVGVVTTIIASMLHIKGAFWSIIFLYVFLANAFFLLRSLRAVILPDASSAPAAQATATVTPATRRRRITFLFLEAVTQIIYMGWLVRV